MISDADCGTRDGVPAEEAGRAPGRIEALPRLVFDGTRLDPMRDVRPVQGFDVRLVVVFVIVVATILVLSVVSTSSLPSFPFVVLQHPGLAFLPPLALSHLLPLLPVMVPFERHHFRHPLLLPLLLLHRRRRRRRDLGRGKGVAILYLAVIVVRRRRSCIINIIIIPPDVPRSK
jgi:hypothetical protein